MSRGWVPDGRYGSNGNLLPLSYLARTRPIFGPTRTPSGAALGVSYTRIKENTLKRSLTTKLASAAAISALAFAGVACGGDDEGDAGTEVDTTVSEDTGATTDTTVTESETASESETST